MRKSCYVLLVAASMMVAASPSATTPGPLWKSTRVISPDQHVYTGKGGYPYREESTYVLSELDLQAGDVVVDIGAGDGWWTERMAELVGPDGIVYASEVDQKLVDEMKKKFTGLPQIRPYLCETDSTGLPENSCDLAFLSKTYHHLDEEGHVAYLRHLRKVLKPTGRICVIEKCPEIAQERKGHAWPLRLLLQETEEAGWVLVRYELMTGTYHYLAIFVQKDLFPAESSKTKPATVPED